MNHEQHNRIICFKLEKVLKNTRNVTISIWCCCSNIEICLKVVSNDFLISKSVEDEKQAEPPSTSIVKDNVPKTSADCDQ